MLPRHPRPSLFPYTTLFRSRFEARLAEDLGARPSADLARIAALLREGRRPAPRPAAPGEVPERQERRFRSEEHTSELQSHSDVVCRLLLEKKKQQRPRDSAA